MSLTVSNKGWVVIPAELRKKYNLQPGKAVEIVDYGGVLAIIPALDEPIKQAQGMLKTAEEQGRSLLDVLLNEHREEQQGE